MDFDPNEYVGFIYITTNKINNKKYIGQKTFGRSWKEYLGSGTYLKKDIQKYGRENFEREIVFLCKDIESLNEQERMFIKKFDAIRNPNFYNVGVGGNNSVGYSSWDSLPKEEKERLRELFRIKNTGKGNPFYGRHHSQETKNILREKSRSRAFGADNPFYGKHHSEKTLAILREKALARQSGEKNSFYGRHHSEESKRKMSMKAKPVGQYDIALNLIRVFSSTKEAAEITGISLTGIRQCVIGANKTSGNYIWKYMKKGI